MTGATWEEHLELVERLIAESYLALSASTGELLLREVDRLATLKAEAARAREGIIAKKGAP
jgi:hypothetical protein